MMTMTKVKLYDGGTIPAGTIVGLATHGAALMRGSIERYADYREVFRVTGNCYVQPGTVIWLESPDKFPVKCEPCGGFPPRTFEEYHEKKERLLGEWKKREAAERDKLEREKAEAAARKAALLQRYR
jgi:hypothetical protein